MKYAAPVVNSNQTENGISPRSSCASSFTCGYNGDTFSCWHGVLFSCSGSFSCKKF